jgi:hypothetical protein
VTLAIQLNHKLRLSTVEINNIRFNRMLSPKLQSGELAAAKDRPQNLLWLGRALAKANRPIAGDFGDAF